MTTTTNYGLTKPDIGSSSWGVAMNANLDAIDTAIAAAAASASAPSGTANKVFATPDGTSGSASLRALVAADIPSLSATKITSGAVALARGGTGVDLSASGSSTAILAQDASHVISARSLILADLPSGTEVTSHKDAASGYAGLDADIKLLAAELPDWLIEGMNNAIVRGPVDGSGNPNYGAVSTVSTTATFKFVCASVNLEMWIAGRYQKVADDNVVTVTLTNGSSGTSPAANFIYLKQNTSVKQLTSSDIGVTSQAPIFGNNQTQPATYSGSDKKFWFNPATNKWMSSTGSAAYVNDPIIPVAVCVIDNTGVELGTAYWGPRMTPWKVMELFGQGTDGAVHVKTGTTVASGVKLYTSVIVSGGNLTHGSIASGNQDAAYCSQAPIVICNAGTVACNGGSTGNQNGGGSIGAVGVTGAGAAGTAGIIGGGGGGGGGATAGAGGVGGGRTIVNSFSNSLGGGAGGLATPTDGSAGGAGGAGWSGLSVLSQSWYARMGAGGASGRGDGTNTGGSGGQGGGGVRLMAPGIFISSTSSVTANGGNGANSAGGNSAGGGGGGGGVIGLFYGYFINNGTLAVNAGSGGTGTGTGKNGGAGGAGVIEQLKCF